MNADPLDIKLVCFDLDGTLITSYMDEPEKDFHSWQPYPGARETIKHHLDAGQYVAIITNQAGIAFGYNTEADWELKEMMVAHDLGLQPHNFYVCFAHPKADPPYNDEAECRRRKPSGLMIREAMSDVGAEPHETWMIGDMQSDADAAKDAGAHFSPAGERFDFQNGAWKGQLTRQPLMPCRRCGGGGAEPRRIERCSWCKGTGERVQLPDTITLVK